MSLRFKSAHRSLLGLSFHLLLFSTSESTPASANHSVPLSRSQSSPLVCMQVWSPLRICLFVSLSGFLCDCPRVNFLSLFAKIIVMMNDFYSSFFMSFSFVLFCFVLLSWLAPHCKPSCSVGRISSVCWWRPRAFWMRWSSIWATRRIWMPRYGNVRKRKQFFYTGYTCIIRWHNRKLWWASNHANSCLLRLRCDLCSLLWMCFFLIGVFCIL